MENQTISLEIPCALHPSETIQRISMDKKAEQHLFCLECVLQSKSNPKTLKPISELIDTAISLYAKKRESITFADQIPSEMLDALSSRIPKINQLTHHIEEEKKRVSSLFDSLSQDCFKIIEEKRTEALEKLDQQIINLRLWYISFDKQLKKTYTFPEDIPDLYPTREDLIAKLGKITNATHLATFLKDMRDDVNEAATLFTRNERELDFKTKDATSQMEKNLLEIAEMKPSYKNKNSDLQKFKKCFKDQLSGLMKHNLKIQNPIPEVIIDSLPKSAFLKPQDFDLIRSWLPRNLAFTPQLLYRGSKDGMNASTFHQLCDGKEKTFTVIKAKFEDSDAISVLGGYLDKRWNSNGWIHSADAFIFSLTEQLKCPLSAHEMQYAASSNPNQGPCFGVGPDIGVWVHGTSSVNPHTYKKSSELLGGSIASEGKTMMEVLDIEVYSVN